MKDCGSGYGQNESYWKHLPCIGHALLYITMHCHPSAWQHGTQERGDSGGLKWRRSDVAFLRITRRFSENRKRSLENSLEKLAKSSVQFLILLGSPSGKKKFWGFLDAFPGVCHDLFSSFVSHHFGYFWVKYLRWRPACCEQKRLSWAGWPWFHSARPCG